MSQRSTILFPHHRPFSYFDCFLCGDFQKANLIIKNIGIEVAGSYKHSTFNYKNVHVENHHFCTYFRRRKKSGAFETLLEEIMTTEKPIFLPNIQLESPTPLFNALFMIWHTRSHFFDERVSIKQVLDWTFIVKKLSGG
ncbi:nucleotidyltransferase family protein [Bacteroides pyogenes]|uniref:nucleotidyltransferase family protein n=1 Tax=Bacteroides pyogenes TaxID=310300 RepID=UPI004064B974